MTDLPQLLDARAIKDELGLRTIDQAYGLMEKLPKYRVGKRMFVGHDDLKALGKESCATSLPALVYVLDCDHGVKVGMTTMTIAERVADLERGSGLRAVRVVRTWGCASRADARVVEAAAHMVLADSKTVGEWFHCHPIEACDVIERIRREGVATARSRLAATRVRQFDLRERT